MRRRARQHRLHAFAPAKPARESNPSPAAAAVMLAMVVVAVAGGVALLGQGKGQSVPVAQPAPMVYGYQSSANPLTLLMINDYPPPIDPTIQVELDRIRDEHRSLGYIVVEGDRETELEIRKWLPAGRSGDPSPLLGKTLRKYDLGGVLHLRREVGEGSAPDWVEAEVILPKEE